jgi:hypothetical protein
MQTGTSWHLERGEQGMSVIAPAPENGDLTSPRQRNDSAIISIPKALHPGEKHRPACKSGGVTILFPPSAMTLYFPQNFDYTQVQFHSALACPI